MLKLLGGMYSCAVVAVVVVGGADEAPVVVTLVGVLVGAVVVVAVGLGVGEALGVVVTSPSTAAATTASCEVVDDVLPTLADVSVGSC